jgi:hypothetical protein
VPRSGNLGCVHHMPILNLVRIRIGGGPDEHGDTAGWGAHAVRVHADDRTEVLADL